MPIYSFEQLIDLSAQRLDPGTLMPLRSTERMLRSTTRNSPIRENLLHQNGQAYALCGAGVCGANFVCGK